MTSNLDIIQVPALHVQDNYIHILRDTLLNKTYVIDPAIATPVIEICVQNHWKIDGILLTHHHWDHVDGAPELVEKFNCPIYGHEKDLYRLPQITKPLKTDPTKNSQLMLGDLRLEYFPIPGHTLGHIGIYIPSAHALFSGDTLFSFGCGRLFEGTAEQMVNSLNKIRALPDDTRVYCGHEYTQKNIEFALTIDPNNAAIQKKYEEVVKLRARNASTVPSLLRDEKRLNPFLRWDDPSLKRELGMDRASDAEVFSLIRQKRNAF